MTSLDFRTVEVDYYRLRLLPKRVAGSIAPRKDYGGGPVHSGAASLGNVKPLVSLPFYKRIPSHPATPRQSSRVASGGPSHAIRADFPSDFSSSTRKRLPGVTSPMHFHGCPCLGPMRLRWEKRVLPADRDELPTLHRSILSGVPLLILVTGHFVPRRAESLRASRCQLCERVRDSEEHCAKLTSGREVQQDRLRARHC